MHEFSKKRLLDIRPLYFALAFWLLISCCVNDLVALACRVPGPPEAYLFIPLFVVLRIRFVYVVVGVRMYC